MIPKATELERPRLATTWRTRRRRILRSPQERDAHAKLGSMRGVNGAEDVGPSGEKDIVVGATAGIDGFGAADHLLENFGEEPVPPATAERIVTDLKQIARIAQLPPMAPAEFVLRHLPFFGQHQV